MSSTTNPKVPESLSELPEEILQKIAAYVPDSFNLSQVCKQFYNIVCEVDKNKKVLVITDLITKNLKSVLNIMDDQLYKSMMTTKRSFDQVTVERAVETTNQFERLRVMFLVKFGSSIKKLSLRWTYLSLLELITILSLMPQLEDLEIRDDIDKESTHVKGDLVHIIKLKKFKVLSIGCEPKKLLRSPASLVSDKYFSDFIFPGLMETLDIKYTPVPADAVALFFQSQPRITSFTLNPRHFETAALASYMGTHFPRGLAYLNLEGMILEDNDFNFIFTNLVNLKELHFNWFAPPEILERIGELRCLEKLVFKYDPDRWDPDNLHHIRSATINEIIIEVASLGGAYDIAEAAKNLPNLRKFSSKDFVGYERDEEFESCEELDLSSLLQHFKRLEELQISCYGRLKSTVANNDGKIHPNIKVLGHKLANVDDDDDPEDALKLLDCLPNLEELTLRLRCRIGWKNEKAEMLRLVGILKKVKSRVKSFKLHFTCDDSSSFSEKFERVFGGKGGGYVDYPGSFDYIDGEYLKE